MYSLKDNNIIIDFLKDYFKNLKSFNVFSSVSHIIL